jgi:hypothetical protein
VEEKEERVGGSMPESTWFFQYSIENYNMASERPPLRKE